MEDLLAHAGTGMLVCGPEWQVTDATAPAARLLGASSDEELEGQAVSAVLPANLGERLTDALAGDDGPVRIDEYLPGTERWAELRAVRIDERALVEVRDVTEWAQQATDLERARTDLSLLSRLVDLVSELLGAVVAATTPEEIQEAVTSQLVAGDLFDLAWVGDWAADREGITVRAWSGDEGVLEAIRDADEPGPERRALETGEMEVVRDVPSDESVPEPVRKAAFASGIQAGVALPLTYGETAFGVLGLYTARPEALDERGLAGIEMLGEVIGFVLQATRQQRALDTATRRELVLAVGPEAGPLARVAAAADCTLSLVGTANVETEVVLAYVSVSGATPDAVTDTGADDPSVERARVVEEGDDGGTCELRLRGDEPLVRLVALGGTIRSATLEPDGGRITVDFSPETDVRSVLDRLSETVEDVELISTRTRERSARTTAAVEQVLAEELTDRQRAALKTAYEAGYFASPRHSTAAEVAESLGVTSPTFSHHLRVAQRKLLAACFE